MIELINSLQEVKEKHDTQDVLHSVSILSEEVGELAKEINYCLNRKKEFIDTMEGWE